MCDYCRLSGKSDECTYEDTRKKHTNMSENVQRREILPVDASSTTDIHSTPDIPHAPSRDLSCVVSAHLSKLHPLVAAFVEQSDMPPGPFFNAVSNVSLDDLSLALYVLPSTALRTRLTKFSRIIFDSYRLSVGLVISEDQRKALIHGDMESGAVHAFFIHYAHIWGCHLYQQFKSDFVLLFLQSIYVYMAVESLSTIKEKQDPILFAQALLMLSEMYFHTHHLDFGLKYLEMTAGIVKRNRLGFVMRSQDSATGPIDVTEGIRQRVGFLSQLLYVETELFLLTGRKPNLFEELEAEFKLDLGVRQCLPLIGPASVHH